MNNFDPDDCCKGLSRKLMTIIEGRKYQSSIYNCPCLMSDFVFQPRAISFITNLQWHLVHYDQSVCYNSPCSRTSGILTSSNPWPRCTPWIDGRGWHECLTTTQATSPTVSRSAVPSPLRLLLGPFSSDSVTEVLHLVSWPLFASDAAVPSETWVFFWCAISILCYYTFLCSCIISTMCVNTEYLENKLCLSLSSIVTQLLVFIISIIHSFCVCDKTTGQLINLNCWCAGRRRSSWRSCPSAYTSSPGQES